MKTPNRELSKLNQLIQEWPKGAIQTTQYLNKKGYFKSLLNRYQSSRWIESFSRGAYKLYNDKIEWYGGLYALQTQLGISVHAGGKTALKLKGYGHYLSEKKGTLYLFGRRGERLHGWFVKHDWNSELQFTGSDFLPYDLNLSFSTYEYRDFSIIISSPERAALEMLYHVPKAQGFDEALQIIENLATLRPNIVQKLLTNCKSIKVNRLFMYMAEKHNHPWLKQLDERKINLGQGKRVIVENGKLDKKYLITIPAARNQ